MEVTIYQNEAGLPTVTVRGTDNDSPEDVAKAYHVARMTLIKLEKKEESKCH